MTKFTLMERNAFYRQTYVEPVNTMRPTVSRWRIMSLELATMTAIGLALAYIF